jgi:hypothetical protein
MHSAEIAESSIQLAMSMTSPTEKEFALVVLTEDGTIVDAHDACKESFGWKRENLAGQDIGTLIPAHRGLLISGILQSVDSRAQVGDDTTFSMRILAQRMDQSSFPAMVVVSRFGESDCWTAAFFHAAPLSPPDPGLPAQEEDIISEMSCTAFEETQEAREIQEVEPSDASDSASSGTAIAAADTFPAFDDGLPGQMPIPELLLPVSSLPVDQPEAANDQSLFIAEIPSDTEEDLSVPQPENLPVATPAAPVKKIAPLRPEAPAPHKKTASSSMDSADESEERLLDRVSFLTSQLGSLHSELRGHAEEQARTQKKLSTFEEQLQETRKSLARATADLAKQKSEPAELESLRTTNKALEEELALYKSTNEALRRTDAEAATQLAALAAELKQIRGALTQESARRQELERKLASLEHDRSELERKSKLEICRLESALKAKELELKQLEHSRALKPPKEK